MQMRERRSAATRFARVLFALHTRLPEQVKQVLMTTLAPSLQHRARINIILLTRTEARPRVMRSGLGRE